MQKANHALYRKLSEPLKDEQAANAAVQGFFDDVYELREKHHIRDVHVIVAGSVIASDGEEREIAASAHLGDSLRAEGMLAYTLGSVARERQEATAHMMRSKAMLAGKNRK